MSPIEAIYQEGELEVIMNAYPNLIYGQEPTGHQQAIRIVNYLHENASSRSRVSLNMVGQSKNVLVYDELIEKYSETEFLPAKIFAYMGFRRYLEGRQVQAKAFALFSYAEHMVQEDYIEDREACVELMDRSVAFTRGRFITSKVVIFRECNGAVSSGTRGGGWNERGLLLAEAANTVKRKNTKNPFTILECAIDRKKISKKRTKLGIK